ncbi:MAG TPA: (2Fe-2S)-binding protein [Thermoanaerobaculia bacterium]|nr:(2Fe-2S)-binding protein [Thermoanaerobaculia bacterium]
MIICICRGKSDRDITRAINNGASTVRDLQRCGIGDQCGSCHNSLRTMIAQAHAAAAAAVASAPVPCPACLPAEAATVHAHA